MPSKKETKSRRSKRSGSWGLRLAMGLRWSIYTLPMALVLLGSYSMYTSPTGGGYFALARVDFDGLDKIEEESLSPLVQDELDKNSLRIDLDAIRGRVESLTWVKSAVVRRRLPDALRVTIVERNPRAIARIGSEMLLVDDEGVILGVHDPGFPLPDAPVVLGLDRASSELTANRARMALYELVMAELSSGDLDHSIGISEIDVSDISRVAVIPAEEPIPVYLGDRDFLDRYLVFLSQHELFEEYKKRHGRIDAVDVTYDKRIIFQTPEKTETGSGTDS